MRFISLVCKLSFFACSFGALSCATLAKDVRAITYPSEFRYMSRDQIRTTMWELADDVVALDQALRQTPEVAISRDEVVTRLRGMEKHAAALGGSGQASNHAVLERNLPRFLRELEAARLSAEATPPNFIPAGSVAGSCTYCHGRGSR